MPAVLLNFYHSILQNDVEGSVKDFDSALELQPQLQPYMWQRGLSLYYLHQYADGAKQFRCAGWSNIIELVERCHGSKGPNSLLPNLLTSLS